MDVVCFHGYFLHIIFRLKAAWRREAIVINCHGVDFEGELDSLMKDPNLKAQVLSTYFDMPKGLDGSLEKTLQKLCEEANEAVRHGCRLLILSDRSEKLIPTRPAIPTLLAIGAVHQHLVQNGLRMSVSIVADAAQCFGTHHFARLAGYGASVICPIWH